MTSSSPRGEEMHSDSPSDEANSKPWIMFLHNQGFFDTSRFLLNALDSVANLVAIPFWRDGSNPIPTMVIDEHASIFSSWWVKKPLSFLASRVLRQNKSREQFDLILVADPIMTKIDLGRFRGKKAYYAIDLPHGRDLYFKRVNFEDYDVIFSAHKDYLAEFKARGFKNVVWLPFACDPRFYRRYLRHMSFDLCFVGSLSEHINPARKELLDLLKNRFRTDVAHNVFLHDLASRYSGAKLGFNKSIMNEINTRVFEVTGCGRALLTDSVQDGLLDIFEDRRSIITYGSKREAIELAEYYLQNDEERERIAEAGQREVYGGHTYLHRAKTILRVAGCKGF